MWQYLWELPKFFYYKVQKEARTPRLYPQQEKTEDWRSGDFNRYFLIKTKNIPSFFKIKIKWNAFFKQIIPLYKAEIDDSSQASSSSLLSQTTIFSDMEELSAENGAENLVGQMEFNDERQDSFNENMDFRDEELDSEMYLNE